MNRNPNNSLFIRTGSEKPLRASLPAGRLGLESNKWQFNLNIHLNLDKYLPSYQSNIIWIFVSILINIYLFQAGKCCSNCFMNIYLLALLADSKFQGKQIDVKTKIFFTININLSWQISSHLKWDIVAVIVLWSFTKYIFS